MKRILAGLRNNGFALVRGGAGGGGASGGWFGAGPKLDAAQAEAVSALDQLRDEYHAQLFTQARHVCHAGLEPQASRQGLRQVCYSHTCEPRLGQGKLTLPPAPWLYKALRGRRVARGGDFSYREGYSCERPPFEPVGPSGLGLELGLGISWSDPNPHPNTTLPARHERAPEHAFARPARPLQRASLPRAP